MRSPTQLQIGVDQQPARVLTGVHPSLGQVLSRLDGRHGLAAIYAEADRLGVAASHLDWSLRTLDEAGLLVDRACQPPRPGPSGARLRLVGAGRLGGAVAGLLAGTPISSLHVIDSSPPDPELYPIPGALGSQAEALVAALGASSSVALQVVNHWSKPEDPAPDLTIVASDLLECDRVVANGLLRADQPHLFVRAGGGGVVVGPLVVPGQTACLHCTDLARCDADSCWSTLLPQLVRARTRVSPAQVGWAAGVAVTQALAYLSGAVPETYGATMELSVEDHLTRWRSWSMHPGCGCGWGSLAEWGP